MKKYSLYIASLALAAVALGACENEFERPPMVLPTSSWQANTTIEDFKAEYWNTVETSPVTVGLNADGDSIIVKGRVCSSDETGNIFKYLFIQGESEALAFSLDFYDIYQSYKLGQEVYVNLTGLTIGGYSGLMCVGYGLDDRSRVARAAEDIFSHHAQTNGLPNTAVIDTVMTSIAVVETAKTTEDGLRSWQSRLVRFDNVRFENAGEPFAVGTSSNSRYIVDDAGNRINVYNSTYADFKDELLPSGTGSVVGILSYYGSNWQVLLIDAAGCIDFNGIATPVFSPVAGSVDAGTEVTLSCATEGAEIHYTLDGSNPTINSTLYTKPIVINEDVTIKAIATKEGHDASQIATARFTISVSGNSIYSETFENGNLGQFTTTVATSGTWTGWRANTSTPACAIANSYVNGANEAATAWLISPAINLTEAKQASVKLEQAFGFYFPTTQESFCTLNIREKGGQWQQLTLTEFPAQGSGNWTSFAENSVNISDFAGKTVEIGFKYVNDGKQSIAWEIKNFSVIADTGSVEPGDGGSVTPEPSGTQFKVVSAITSGKKYAIVANGKMGVSFGSKTYGYLSVTDVTITDGTFSGDPENSFIFTQVDGGYTIQEAGGRYLYMTGTYNSFNLDETRPSSGAVWSVTFSDGKATIINLEMNKSIQYDTQYGSFGVYPDVRGIYPTLYELVD